MNKKGFTLIELLATIVIIALVSVLVAPYVIDSYKSSKEQAYNILIDNIKIAGENYYKECEFGTLDECKDPQGSLTVTLKELSSLGLLKGSAESKENSTYEYKTVKNPKTGNDISNCQVTITKNTDKNSKTTYTVDGLDSFSSCEE